MYLKSLVLKGFKSFADRSTLSLEPGITAVVGPNGSGKSNISDAVLWVLGERNAKHLRGQAMEDVIFAGSSARKATGLAEVELVLDNSDGKLPVDFNEVSITRRMYRSGESEYLINGSVARRMDVLDILHDSGLGTGTHSIIGQGSLDSILQSKPEDRRALIEEAAGVLKHKQRKAKSERKLAAMDATLARVRDVAGEVGRQLGPLERKAKKARAYQELSGQLTDVSLALAVDDLRCLRQSWDEACAGEHQLVEDLLARHQDISTAEAAAEALQEQIRKQTQNAGDLSRSYQRASSAVERFDGAVLLLHEKRRGAQGLEADVRVKLESGRTKRAEAVAEREQAAAQLEAVRRDLAAAQAAVERLDASRRENAQARRSVEDELDQLKRQGRADDRASEDARRRLSQTQEALANGLAHAKLVEGRAKELELALGHAEEQAQKLEDARACAQRSLDDAQQAESQARGAVAAAIKERDAARAALDEAHRRATSLESRISALEEVERASAAAGPARAWLMEHARISGQQLEPLARVVRAPQGFEALVEHLLSGDAEALMAPSIDAAACLAGSVLESGRDGQVSLLPADGMRSGAPSRQAAQACGGTALVDMLEYPEQAASTVEALLGDVVVCDTFEAARHAQAARMQDRSAAPVRFVSADGCIAWPSGKLTVGTVDAGAEGALARARQLDELRASLRVASDQHKEAEQTERHAEEALRAAQAESLQLSQQLAERRGAAQAASAEAKRAADALASTRREFADVERKRQQADKTVAEARPNVDKLETQLAELAQAAQARAVRTEELEAKVVPLRKEAAQLRDGLSEAKLSAATLRERDTYTARIVDARGRDVAAVDAAEDELKNQLARKIVAQRRIAPLLAVFEELTASARRWTHDLEQRAQQAQDSSAGLHAQVTAARERAKAAHDAYDDVNARLSAARVEKGRLEVRVDAAVNSIAASPTWAPSTPMPPRSTSSCAAATITWRPSWQTSTARAAALPRSSASSMRA